MRRILLCTALILGSCFSTQSIEHLLTSRHAVFVDTPVSTGSGFPITDDAFLTAWHIVVGSEAKQITVGGWIVYEVVRLEGIDAALLFTRNHGLQPWPLGKRGPRPGQRVWKSGYGLGHHWWTEGIGTEDVNRVALDIFLGDSGGPVFNVRGEVLGIVVSMGSTGLYYATHQASIIPIGDILPLLPANLFEKSPAKFPAPLQPHETPWEEFLRLRKERLGY